MIEINREKWITIAFFTLLILAALTAHASAGHTEAVDTADRLNTALAYVGLPYERDITQTQMTALGYETTGRIRSGTYTIHIKSASVDTEKGTLNLYINAWNNGNSIAVRNPVKWYIPATISGSTHAGRINAFALFLLRYLEYCPDGEPQNDDTLVVYCTDNQHGRVVGSTAADTWANIRAAAGNTESALDATTGSSLGVISTSSTEDRWDFNARYVLAFDTSALPDTCTIDSAIVAPSVYAEVTGFGTYDLGVTGGTVADTGEIDATDYAGFTDVRYATDQNSGSTGSGYINFTLNAAGLASISKTGFSAMFFRTGWDIDNSPPVWASATNGGPRFNLPYRGEAYYPVLYITYTPGGGSAPVAAFSANTTSGYPDFDIAFTDSSTNTPTTWDWLFGDGETSSEQSPVHTYNFWIGNTITKYTVNLTAVNAFGSDAENKTDYIWAYPLNASFSFNVSSGCAPLHVGFTDATDNGTPSAWSWNFGGDGTASTQNVTHVFTTPGTYWISLNASNSYSFDTENKTELITVNAGTVAAFSANQTSGNAPLHVGFTDASGAGITNWTWDFENDGTPDSYEQNPSHIYGSTGTYTVNLTVTGSCGTDSEVKTDYITVSENAPVAGFSANATTGCANLHVQFTDSSTGTITNWSWDFQNDGNPDSYEQNPVAIFGAGTFTVNLTVTSAFGTDSEVKTDYITAGSASVSADFSVDDTTPVAGQEIHFTDESTGGPSAWQWSWGDGTANGTTQNPAHTYSTPGNYTVNLTATNPCGGADTEEKVNYIIVGEAPTPTPTPAEAEGTNVGETWIRWVWEDLLTPFDLYIDGIPTLFNVSNATTSYRLTGLNPSEKHILGLYNNTSGELILEQDATTLPATWFLLSILGISILFGTFTIFTRDAYRALMTSLISCVTSAFLVMISVGHSWGISICAIVVAVITGVVVVLILMDLRDGDDDE